MVPTGPMPALQRARKDAHVDPESIVKRAKVPGSIGLAVEYGECGLNRIVVIVPHAGGAKAGAARPQHPLSLRESVASTQSTRRRASRVRGSLACQPILREYSSPSPQGALHIKLHQGRAFCAKYRLFVQAISGRRRCRIAL